MSDQLPEIIELYVSDDGQVMFREPWHHSYELVEPLATTGLMERSRRFNPTDPPEADDKLIIRTRHYRLRRYHCGSVALKEWIGRDVERAKALVRACETNAGAGQPSSH